jgi:hypothetical protein
MSEYESEQEHDTYTVEYGEHSASAGLITEPQQEDAEETEGD